MNDISHTIEDAKNASLKDFGNFSNIEISIPAVRDPSLAPKDKTGIIMSAPMFAKTEQYDWLSASEQEYEKMKEEVIEGILKSVSAYSSVKRCKEYLISIECNTKRLSAHDSK